METADTATEAATSKPLPPKPALPSPDVTTLHAALVAPPPSLAADLDSQSTEHYTNLLKQSLSNAKLDPAWEAPFLRALLALSECVTPELIGLLTRSAIAEWKSRDATERTGAALASKEGKKPKDKDKDKDKKGKEKEAPSEVDVEEVKRKNQEQARARWSAAIELLKSQQEEHPRASTSSIPQDGECIATAGADGKEPEGAKESEDEPALLKLTHFVLLLRCAETTVSAIQSGSCSINLSFDRDQWDGDSLFGKDENSKLDSEDLVNRAGGTFHLTSTAADAKKLRRVLELMSFTVLSLKLESYLLHDTNCPRPLPALDDVSIAEEVDDVSPPPPVPKDAPRQESPEPRDEFPSEEWNLEKREKKSRWSKGNLWGLLLGFQPRASSRDTESSSASIHSTTPSTRKVSDRIKGLRSGLKSRKDRSKRSKGPEFRRGPSMESEEGDDNGWDFVGGLGLGLFGPRSSATFSSRSPSPEPNPAQEEATEVLKNPTSEEEPVDRFQNVIQKMQRCILSTSPNVHYPPPHLLVRLRQEEILHSAALSVQHAAPLPPPSIPSSPPSSGSNFFPSFGPSQKPNLRSVSTTLNAQTLAIGFAAGTSSIPEMERTASGSTVPFSPSATRIALDARAGLASLLTNNNSLAGTIRHQSMQFLVETVSQPQEPTKLPCKAPRWTTYNFYDDSEPKEEAGGTTFAKDMTLGELIERTIVTEDVPCDAPDCKKTGKEHCTYWMHSKERIGISLAKIAPPEESALVDELASPPDSVQPRILAWTTCKTCHEMTRPTLISPATYSFSCSKFFELLLYDANFVPLPTLCEHATFDRGELVRSFAMGTTVVRLEIDQIELFELRLPTSVDPDRHELEGERAETDVSRLEGFREEIKSFFHSVHRRLDLFQDIVLQHEAPLLPTTDPEPSHDRSASEKTIIEAPDTLKGTTGPISLLVKLRHNIDSQELTLLEAVDDLAPSQLNINRFSFVTEIKAIRARLGAWATQHLGDSAKGLPPPSYDLPDYYGTKVHAFPVESSVLVREEELSSLIALTLSSSLFQDEVGSAVVPDSRRTSTLSTPATSRKSSRQPIPMALFDEASRSRLSTLSLGIPPSTPPLKPSSNKALDPDDPAADFSTPQDIEMTTKVKKVVRTGSSILNASIRLPKERSTESFSSGLGLPAFFRSPLASPLGDGVQLGDEPPILPNGPIADSVLEDLVGNSDGTLPKKDVSDRAIPSVIMGLTSRNLAEPKTTSSVSLSTVEVDASHQRTRAFDSISFASVSLDSSETSSLADKESGNATEDEEPSRLPDLSLERGSRLISGSLNAIWNLPGSLRLRSPKPNSLEGIHIKFNFRNGQKAFRVTAWYAQRFQALRTRSGLSESLFIESLSRCSNLNTSGGKSKAAFWMTTDKRFIMKELVSAWGISEREAFLSFAPSLLDYLMASERPTLLARIYGFYTVKMKDISTGDVTKLDLVVMENLFHAQTITRQFDLKGVASRVAKQSAGAEATGETGWDGDWLSGSLKTRLLIYAHSKTLLRDALLRDSTFLSNAGNVDYSLLVGVDDTSKQMTVGLIDVLGVFNALKLIENVGKTVIKRAGGSDADAVTVQPPSEYAKRFRDAMNKYFVSVPEKFSRPDDGAPMELDPRLASVL